MLQKILRARYNLSPRRRIVVSLYVRTRKSGTILLDHDGFMELSEMSKSSFSEFIYERMITRSSDPKVKEGVDAVGFILASYNFCSTPKESLPSFLFDIFSRGRTQMDQLHTVRMIKVLYRSKPQFETKGKYCCPFFFSFDNLLTQSPR